MFLSFGMISCFRIRDEKDGVLGVVNWGGAGGISTGPSLEMVSNSLEINARSICKQYIVLLD